MTILRQSIGLVLSLVGLGFAKVGAWIAGVPVVDPVIDTLDELRNTVRDIPTLDVGVGAVIARSAVLAAIGEAITEAES